MPIENFSNTDTVRGYIKRIRFQNEENGFCIFTVEDEISFNDTIVTGIIDSPFEGAYIIAHGQYVIHPKFGRQLKATNISETLPADAQGVEKYLSSGIVSGIGEKTAGKIVGLLGKNAIEKIIKDPNVLNGIKGLSKKKIKELHIALSQQQEDEETLRFLIEHNISSSLATLIYKKFGKESIKVVTKTPYILCKEITGIGFLKADDIAIKMGILRDDPKRIEAGILYALEKASEDGHCYVEAKNLDEKIFNLLGLEEPISLTNYIDNLEIEKRIVVKNDKIFLRKFDFAEEFIAKYVTKKISQKKETLLSKNYIKNIIPRVQDSANITYSQEQIDAINIANENKLVLITGGPGCGKTTIVYAIARIFAAGGLTVKLCAPTGKAAQRLGAVCNMKAKTIHRMLKFDPATMSFTHDADNQLNVDVLIIDECSMIDLLLAKDLFLAIPMEATIIMVGDKDQLPPVGAGKVFADLLSIKEISKIILSKIFRRNEESRINEIAFNVNEGITPKIPLPDGITKTDAYFIPKDSALDTATLIEKLVAEQIPLKFGFSQDEIMVLTPMNKGPLGTIELNKRLQKILNPIEELDSEQEIISGDTSFRLNDRVCQRVNDYNLGSSGVFNGDTGVITEVNSVASTLTVRLWDGKEVTYQKNNLLELQLAYAMSVHRSQGSEIPCVILALHKCHFTLLERQLIYTAITRAKKLLIVVGQEEALKIAVSKQLAIKRNCLLSERINFLLNQYKSLNDF